MRKICILLLFFCSNKLLAQTPTVPPAGVTITQAIPASADAASLGKYGSIPVSAYTGVPNISIPLYTIKSGDLSLPVSLSYHSGGFKTEEMASSVGLGWVLNAGGSISRTQRGKADEDLNGALTSSAPETIDNYMRNYSTLTSSQKTQLDFLLNEVADGTIDGEADVFNYNFGGYSGKFIMDASGNFYVIPLQNIKFSVTVTGGQTTNITAFTAKTPDGVTYYFGSSGATEYTYSPTNKHQTSMSWFVYKIVSPSLHEIDFTYTPEEYKTNQAPSQTIYKWLGFVTGVQGQSQQQAQTPSPILPTGSVIDYNTVKLTGITFENGSLTVYANSNRNDLNPPPATTKATAIDSISINSSSLSKKYHFYYLNTTSNRLRLDSLIGQLEPISGTNNYKKEKYSFSYNVDYWTNNTNTNFLLQQDWWGYYNGQIGNYGGNATLLPTTSYTNYGTTVTITADNRAPNPSTVIGGLLNEIDYPTGGHTLFTFEGNQESNINLGSTGVACGTSYVTAFSNDNTSVYYNYDNRNGNPHNLMAISATSGNTIPVTISASGFMGVGAPSTFDNIAARIYQTNAAGDSTTSYASINNTSDTVIYLPTGNYKLVYLDGKGQLYNAQTNPNGYKITLAASWCDYTPAQLQAQAGNYYAGGARIRQIADYDGINAAPINLKTYQYLQPGSTISSGWVDFHPVYNYELDIESNITTNGGIPSNQVDAYLDLTSYSNYPLVTTQGSVVGYSHVTETFGSNGQNGMNEYFYTNSQTNPDLQNMAQFPFAPSESQDWHRGLLLKETTWKSTGSETYSKVNEKANAYTTTNNQTYRPLIKAGFNPKPSAYSQGASYFTNPNANEFGRVVETTYHDVSDFTVLTSDTARIFDQNNPTQFVQTVNKYQYDQSTYELTQLQTTDSKNELITQTVSYPNDYLTFGNPTNGSLVGVQNLYNMGIFTYPVEETTQRSNLDGTNARTIKAVLTTYKPTMPYRDSVFEMRAVAGVTGFVPSSAGTNNITKDSHYQPVVVFNKYDVYGNILQEQKVGDVKHTYIWGYTNSNASPINNTYPIAEVINADSTNVAYANFEQLKNIGSTWGNWTFNYSGIITDATAPMGPKCFSVSGTNTLTKSGLTSTTTYVVSFWAKSGAAITVTGGTVTNVATGNAKSGWIYHEYSVTGTTSVTVGGTGSIDEVRLYPSTAQMSTYTYAPLVGMASKCDVKNDITYFVYDNVGRLIQVLDQNQNIVKQYQYNYLNTPYTQNQGN